MDLVSVEKRCIVCGEMSQVIVSGRAYARWMAGEHAQNVWPRMPVERREQLISGTHGECFDKLFGDGEEE